MGSFVARRVCLAVLAVAGLSCAPSDWTSEEELGAASAQDELLRAPSARPRSSYLKLVVKGRAARDSLGRQLDVDRVDRDTVWAYASPAQRKWLDSKGLAYEELPHPGFNPGAKMGLLDRDGRAHWDHFPTYAEYVQVMQQLANDHPSRARLVNLGPSTNLTRPHAQWAMKITDNPDIAEDEPEVLLTSTMHGDETTGYVLLLKLVEELLTLYSTDVEIRDLVDNLEISINPLANPDGTYYAGDHTVSGAIRSFTDASGNDAWVDPNRNFPDPMYGDHPDGEAWWRETQNMMAFANQRSFVLSGNFHGGAEVINYPWDHKGALHPDNAWFVQLARGYADLCQLDGPAGYLTDLNDGITNGYAWYQVTGGRQDYMLYFHGGRELTLEISGTKNPAAATLPTFWNANRRALLSYLGQALKGIRGTVKNAAGQPLDATVTVLNHDAAAERSSVSTDPAVGNYHRLIAPGTYSLRFSAEGYVSQDRAGVVVGTGSATRVDVVLAEAARADFAGVVLDDRDRPLPGATVDTVATSRPAQLTRRSGDFRYLDLPENGYTVRVSMEGWEPLEQSVQHTAAGTRLVLRLQRQHLAFSTDLEAGNGGLVASGTPAPGWQWGSGYPLGAYSGTRAWKTVNGASYANNADYRLDLAALQLPALAPRLGFWHRYDCESGYDGGRLELSANGGSSFTTVAPVGGYPQQSVDALGGPGYSGDSGGWVQATFDLSAWAGQTVVLRWRFASDGWQTDAGWSIDDVRVTGRKGP